MITALTTGLILSLSLFTVVLITSLLLTEERKLAVVRVPVRVERRKK